MTWLDDWPMGDVPFCELSQGEIMKQAAGLQMKKGP
jgi:hypothetical protein